MAGQYFVPIPSFPSLPAFPVNNTQLYTTTTHQHTTTGNLCNAILASPSTINSQTQSPLFSTIPPELRTEIFHHALLSHPDPTQPPYSRHTHYTRPEHLRPPRISTSLLGTCKRIYLETHLLPITLNEHVFWCGRGPPPRRSSTNRPTYEASDSHTTSVEFRRMTPEQRAAVRELRFYTQQFWLESSFYKVFRASGVKDAVRKISVVLRHGDWWFWESEQPLGIDPRRSGRTQASDMIPMHPDPRQRRREDVCTWGGVFRTMNALREVVMEFETLARKRAQLDFVISIAKTWIFEGGERGDYLWDGEVVKEEWEGSAMYDPSWMGNRTVFRRDDGRYFITAEANGGESSQSGTRPTPGSSAPAGATGLEPLPTATLESGLTPYYLARMRWVLRTPSDHPSLHPIGPDRQ